MCNVFFNKLTIMKMAKVWLFIHIIKPTRCINFSNLFWNKTLHVSDSSSVRHQKFFTVHTAMVYVNKTCMTYTIAVCTVKNSWWWTEELSETCRVLFQNKVEKLVNLVGFTMWIYHDARSPECQNVTVQSLLKLSTNKCTYIK